MGFSLVTSCDSISQFNQSGKIQLNNRLIDDFQKWFDKRLAWDHLPDYRHVQFIFDTDENTWTPAVFVENS